MLEWISQKESNKPHPSVPSVKKSSAVSEDTDWYSPNQSLDAIEVKELSIAEFMAVYKPGLK